MIRAGWRTWVIGVVVATGSGAMGARPLATNDAEPIERGKWQVEAGASFARHGQDEREWAVPVALGYGIAEKLEIGLAGGAVWARQGAPGEFQTAGGAGDVSLAAKWKLLEQEKFLADQALSLSVKFPTGSRRRGLGSGEWDFDATWISSRAVGEKLAVHGSLGYTWLGDPPGERIRDILHYGLAATYQLTETLQPVFEVIGHSHASGLSHSSWALSGGLRWTAAPGLVLDAAVGRRLQGDYPQWLATVGLTWVF